MRRPRCGITVTLGLALALSGCAMFPRPHSARLTPGAQGVLTAAGLPVVEAPVFLCEASPEMCCTGKTSTTHTNRQGELIVAPPQQFRLFSHLMAHTTFYWCLGVEHNHTLLYSGPFENYSLYDSGPMSDYEFACALEGQTLICQAPLKRPHSSP